MKLRIRGNSVRIRLTRSEVARLGSEMPIEQTTRFSQSSVLRSCVKPARGVAAPRAEFDERGVTITLPAGQARQWASSEEVTIEAHQEIEPGTRLQILVEKDFECLEPREGEDASDLFPHPAKSGR
jgi:hypothetical protein